MFISRFPPYVGGTEIQCLRLSRQLSARGHHVSVLTEQPRDSVDESRASFEDIDVFRFATFGAPPFSSVIYALKSLLHALNHRDFDVFHAHMIALPAFVAIAAGRILGIPVLVKIAGGGATGEVGRSRSLIRGHLKLALFKRAAPFVVCPSEQTFRELKQIGLQETLLNRIPNGIDTRVFQPPGKGSVKSSRADLNLPVDRRIAIYSGRWTQLKRIDSLLAAWERGLENGDWQWDLLLLLAGPLSNEQKLQLERLRPHVHVRLNVDNCVPYYHSSDLAVLISTGEGLSNFLLEAMSCGLPTLTTEAAAISDSPERETWGWVLDETSLIPNMVGKLLQFQQDLDSLTKKGERAREIVQERYSIDRIASLYENLYTQMIKAKRS
jgi:glycosyltransferase involved in cell wall biosynthesis